MPDHFAIGAPLPRAEDAYTSHEKWRHWILARRGHGAEWARVLRAQPRDATQLWLAIAQAVLTAPICLIRDRGAHGLGCGVIVTIEFNSRVVPITTAWNYADPAAAPRLVTAYPTL